MARERSEPYPAFVASALLHLGVLAAAVVLSQMFNKPIRMGDVTTVTLVTSADVANLRAAQPAPTPVNASTPTPTPDAQPTPVAQPTPKQAEPTPATNPKQATTTPAKQGRTQEPDPLGGILADLGGGGGHPSPAPKGKGRQSGQPTPGTRAGSGRVAAPADVAGLTSALEKIWVHSCEDVNAADANVDVSFSVGPDGYLLGDPVAKPPNTIAARRAINAIRKLEPFKDFHGLNGRSIPNVHFNAKEACAQR